MVGEVDLLYSGTDEGCHRGATFLGQDLKAVPQVGLYEDLESLGVRLHSDVVYPLDHLGYVYSILIIHIFRALSSLAPPVLDADCVYSRRM